MALPTAPSLIGPVPIPEQASAAPREVPAEEDLVVGLFTQRDGRASFQIVGVTEVLPMPLRTPLGWEGRYRNPGERQVADAPVTVTFRPATGEPAQTFPAGTVTLFTSKRVIIAPGLRQIPGWVEQVADAMAFVATAWLIAQAISWLGIDNWIIAIAMGVAAVALFPGFVEPARRFLRSLFITILDTLVELVEFFAQWLQAVAEHFGGNMVRAVIRMVALAAFMWIWTLARQIPVIGQLIDLIVETAGKLIRFINEQVDRLLGELEKLRRQARADVEDVLDRMGVLGKAIREDILTVVDTLFRGLAGELQEVRFDLLGRLDLVGAALRAEVEILGQRIRIVPQEVVAFLRDRVDAAARQEEHRLRNARAATPPLALTGAAPWEAIEAAAAEVTLAIAGVPEIAGAQGDPFIADLRRLSTQAPAYLQGWLDDQITALQQRLAGIPTTPQAVVDAAIADLNAVLRGRPLPLPDLPADLLPVPPPAPAEPRG